MNLSRTLAIGFAALLSLGLVACGDSDASPDATAEASPPPAETTPEQTAMPTEAAATTIAAPTEEAMAQEYNSTANMRLLFTGRGHQESDTFRALELARQNADKSLVPVVLELMRFFGTSGMILESLAFLTDVTGQDPATAPQSWRDWQEWYGNNSEGYRPPEGYVEWKADVLSLIDPRFKDFLVPYGEDALIDLTEVMWGGVRPDGIPDLQFVPFLAPGDATYLNPDDKVFGVSINGEHRAYPLRIVNAHEMANDNLGGEPIALAY